MKKIICIMFISLCFFVSGCNSTGNNNIINNLDGQGKDKVELGAPLYGDKYISGKILNNNNYPSIS